MKEGPEQRSVKSIPRLRRLRWLHRNCSKIDVFIVRVVVLGLGGAPAPVLFFWLILRTHRTKHLLLGPKLNSSRRGSRKFARFRAGDGSAQNVAANLMGLVKLFFEDFAS